MNPFNLDSQYDEYLADLIEKINKSSVLAVNESIQELLTYLPKSNYFSDYQIILKTLKPLLGSPGKLLINKIVYFLAKKVGPDSIDLVRREWLYENFDFKDPYAHALIEKYFEFSEFSVECLKTLTWKDYLKDLQFFKFLLFKTAEANKPESEIELAFDVTKLPITTYLELDLLYEIIAILKARNPIEFVKYSMENNERCVKLEFVSSLFEAVKAIKSTILLTRKYKILIENFNFVDDTVYEESKNLDMSILFKVLEMRISYDRLSVSTAEQLILVFNKVLDKRSYIINNIKKGMCIFQLLENLEILKQMVQDESLCSIFGEIANESVKRHFITKICRYKPSKESLVQNLALFIHLLTGRNKIIAASLLEVKLDPSEFELSDIDDSMEHSVNVFPLNFFLKHSFRSSAVHVLKKYPELCTNGRFIDLIRSFENTKPEDVIKAISNIETLVFYFERIPIATIKKLCSLNTSPLLKIVYLFYLRDEAESFDVDYSVVFEHFLESNFISYLLDKNNNIDNFIENCTEFIKSLEIENSIYFSGCNFDSDSHFYYNLKPIAKRNDALNIIHSALKGTSNRSAMLETLNHLIEIIQHRPVEISENLKKKLTEEHFVDMLNKLINFGPNQFIVENFLLQYKDKKHPTIDLEILKINPKKAIDVILRNIYIPKRYLNNLDPQYLSNSSLELVIKSVLDKEDNPDPFLLESNRIDFKVTKDQSNESELISKTEKLTIGSNSEIKFLVETYFKSSSQTKAIDFLYLIESDKVLYNKEYRAQRLAIYKPLIQAVTSEFSHSFLNLYSMTKLESNLENNDVFDMIFAQLKEYRNTFWLLLFNTIVKSNNLYMCFFIEEMVIKYTESPDGRHFLNENRIIHLDSYLDLCTDEELSDFWLAFPTLYSKNKSRTALCIEDYLTSIANMKVDNGKISYTKSPDFYKLKLVYRADSLTHTAVISIPSNYPKGKPRIEFETDKKSIKFYHKLNELLSKTSKFVEIFFLWKIDIDNHLIGHTECLICYFIMDPKYKQLPNFKCKTCKNIFHDKCIYKWAAQSKKSQCPFCRSELDLWDKI